MANTGAPNSGIARSSPAAPSSGDGGALLHHSYRHRTIHCQPYIHQVSYVILAFLGFNFVKGGSQFFINVAHNDFLDWFSPGAMSTSPLTTVQPLPANHTAPIARLVVNCALLTASYETHHS